MSLKSELCLGDGHLSLDAHMGLDQGADLAVQPCQEKEVHIKYQRKMEI